MQQNSPFSPVGVTTTLVVTGTNQYLTLPSRGTAMTVRLLNSGTQVVFVEFGTGVAAATVAASMPLMPGVVEVIACPQSVTAIAAIAPTTGSTLYATLGYGN